MRPAMPWMPASLPAAKNIGLRQWRKPIMMKNRDEAGASTRAPGGRGWIVSLREEWKSPPLAETTNDEEPRRRRYQAPGREAAARGSLPAAKMSRNGPCPKLEMMKKRDDQAASGGSGKRL